MTAVELKREARLRDWSEKVAECRSSGMTVTAWCEEQGIALSTYYHWERKVVARASKEAESDVAAKPAILESTAAKPVVTDMVAAKSGVTEFTELPGAAKIMERRVVMTLRTRQAEVDIYEGASREMVTTVCEALKGC